MPCQREGDDFVAFVALGDGRFESRKVRTGRKGDGFVEILDGLSAGESVVVSGTFVLKSEASKESLGRRGVTPVMIRRIVDFSLDNRFLVIVLWLLVAAGRRSTPSLDLPIDAVPDVTNVQVQVLTNSPGLAPEEVEKFVTFPVETAMSGLPKVEEIRSISSFGLSAVTVVFEEDDRHLLELASSSASA